MKHLITGASGFIGTYLLKSLKESYPKDEIFTLTRKPYPIVGTTNLVEDMTDNKKLNQTLQGLEPDRVYHLVGVARVLDSLGMPEYFSQNFLTTQNLVGALANSQKSFRLFFASSVHVYGNQDGLIEENASLHPISCYGFTKYLAERLLQDAVRKYSKMDVLVGRLYTSIGPGQDCGFVVSDFCHKIAALGMEDKQTLEVGSLSGWRQFMDVRDMVQTFPKLLEKKSKERYQVYNIAGHERIQIGSVLELLLRISGKKARVESKEGHAPNKFFGLQVSTTKLEELIGKSFFRPIEDTLKDTYSAVDKLEERAYGN